ncbi:MAG: hypothetical protein GSR72_04730 [Desulfurococcales archaeon]|nr:hypothetical protein [Desulfurococcales archaeon]
MASRKLRVLARFYSFSLSDPSLAEVLAVVLGLVVGVSAVLLIFHRSAYEAALYATPISPFGGVKPYVPGYINPPTQPSEEIIYMAAGTTYPSMIYKYKLQIWIVWAVSQLSVLYPLIRRVRASIISAAGILNKSPLVFYWAGLLPVVLVVAGQSLSFYILALGVGDVFFNYISYEMMTEYVAGVLLYGVALGVWFYTITVTSGRLEIGAMYILLASLGIDRLVPDPGLLLIVSILFTAAGIIVLYTLLWRRWLRI